MNPPRITPAGLWEFLPAALLIVGCVGLVVD